MILNNGTILNSLYKVISLLGSGAMGNVYLVERLKDGELLVIKELIFNSGVGLDPATAREIFFREAEFIAKFDHPGLPKMYGVFTCDGRDYLTMEYIEGQTLEKIITTSMYPIHQDKAIKWAIELAEIMDYLHNSFHTPIVYRDLKPSNIIITHNNKPRLVDFGIARYYNPDKNTDTFSFGSPGYAAPEQYKGRGQSCPQSDVFGLGVILYQMLTLYDPTLKPFTFPDMISLNRNIPKSLENIVVRAIQLDPLKRYLSMLDFKETLEKYSGFKSPVYNGTATAVSQPQKGTSPTVFWIIGIVILLAIFTQGLIVPVLIGLSLPALLIYALIRAGKVFLKGLWASLRNKSYNYPDTWVALIILFLLGYIVWIFIYLFLNL